jgi:hypothetical protein
MTAWGQCRTSTFRALGITRSKKGGPRWSRRSELMRPGQVSRGAQRAVRNCPQTRRTKLLLLRGLRGLPVFSVLKTFWDRTRSPAFAAPHECIRRAVRGLRGYRYRLVDPRNLPQVRRHQFDQKRPSAMAWWVTPIARRLGLTGRPCLAGPRRHSKCETRAVVLRRDSQQAQEAAAHCFFRAETATLRDPFDR